MRFGVVDRRPAGRHELHSGPGANHRFELEPRWKSAHLSTPHLTWRLHRCCCQHSIGIARLRRQYEPSATHRARPIPRGLSVDRALDHVAGFPHCARFPCVHAVATAPAQPLAVPLRSSLQGCQPSPIWHSGRPAHRPFRGLLGVHLRYGLHTRAVTVCLDTLTRRLQPISSPP
jgi:hypothetical protein